MITTIFLFSLLGLSAFNSYLLLSLTKGHFLFFIGKRIPLNCDPCRAFWLSALESIVIFSYFVPDREPYYLLLPFLISAITMIFYKFIE